MYTLKSPKEIAIYTANAVATSGSLMIATAEIKAIFTAGNYIKGNPTGKISSKGYRPQPGERTLDGFVKNNVSTEAEVKLYTNSSGFNNVSTSGGQFKRFGSGSHADVEPHVHQPIRNQISGTNFIRGVTGSRTGNGGVTSPNRQDIKHLYDYLFNGKYRP